jgi:hypothetical protein
VTSLRWGGDGDNGDRGNGKKKKRGKKKGRHRNNNRFEQRFDLVLGNFFNVNATCRRGKDKHCNGTMRIWKILDGKLPQKLERAHSRIIGSLGGRDRGECLGLGCSMEFFHFIVNSHTRAHTRNTMNRCCGDFASNSCTMGPRYQRGDTI